MVIKGDWKREILVIVMDESLNKKKLVILGQMFYPEYAEGP